MKTIVIFLLCAAVAFAAPAEEAPVLKEEMKEVPALNMDVEEEQPALSPEVHSAQTCFQGWEYFRGNCYHLNNNDMTWTQAVEYCAEYEATLAAVHSLLHFNHLKHMAGSASHESAWTGGFHFEGSWRWQDGSTYGYNKFEPGCDSTANKCILMHTLPNRGWFSSVCNFKAPSICQIKANC